MTGFSMKATGVTVEGEKDPTHEQAPKDWVRDDSDNKLFTSIQVKDITSLIHEGTVGIYDADTLIYQACANMETKFIVIKHKTEDVTEELPNISTFKGLGKKIKDTSWLGLRNVDRELQGLSAWCVGDFEIEDGQRLKYDSEEKAIEQAKIQIHLKLKQVRKQFRIPKIKLVTGEGSNFRHELDLCRPYKGNRKETSRPLILKQVRAWAVEELGAEMAVPRYDGQMVEADDTCEYYGQLGMTSFRKTGKADFVVIASDKDALGNPKILCNPDTHSGKDNPLRGKFKFPQAMLIESTDKSVGDLELVAKKSGSEVKGYGFKFILYQALLGQDTADNYNALSHLEKKLDFGDQSAYKILKPCKTAQEALQAAIDVYSDLLPYGVQYTTHDGRELDVDCMEYMNTYFKVAYMMRSANDKMDFYKLCEVFKVDTSKIVGNNSLTPPKPVFIDNEAAEEKVIRVSDKLGEILNKELNSYKSLKKGDIVKKLDTIKEQLQDVVEEFESFYEMKQEAKEVLQEEVVVVEDPRIVELTDRLQEAEEELAHIYGRLSKLSFL